MPAWFPAWTTLVDIALRTLIVYFVLLIGLRLTGRRQIGQLTPFDLVVLLLLSNSVQNAMTGPDTTVMGGIIAATTLLLVNLVVARIRMKHMGFRKWVEGVPVPLVVHGQIQSEQLLKEQITEEELMANLREHEVRHLDQCELAMLEIDGSISVIRRTSDTPSQLVKSRKRLIHHHKHE